MNPIKQHPTDDPVNQFLKQINDYMKKNSWQEENITVDKIKELVADSDDYIKVIVENASSRQQLSAFVERIKQEFPTNDAAKELAADISSVINKKFFECGDTMKKIFYHLTPTSAETAQIYRPPSNLQDATRASTSWRKNAEVSKQQWVEEEVVSLKIYGLKTPAEAIQYIVDHKLSKINLREFDFSEKDMEELFSRRPNITSLFLSTALKEWPEMKSLEVICLYQCEDASIKSLAKKGPKLQSVHLRGTQVGDEGIKSLAEN